MIKTYLTLLLIIFISFSSFAQKKYMKWGKIAPLELSMTVYEKDTSAPAVVLADVGEISVEYIGDEFVTQFKKHRRIKIMKEEGLEFGDIEVPYYSKSKIEKITRFDGQVISPDGTITKLKKSEIFDEKVNDYWSQKKASLPNLQVGSIIEYRYDIKSDRIQELDEWYFQEYIPIMHSELKVTIPEWFDYVYLVQGEHPFHKKEKSTLMGNMGGLNTVFNRIEYVMKDVPALEEESYITTMDDYLARIRFQLNSIEFPNSYSKSYLSTWQELSEELYDDENFGIQFTKKRTHLNILKAFEAANVKGETQIEKAYNAAAFLLSNMEWNGRFSSFSRGSLDNCFKLKKANSAELNFAMIVLLRQMGIEAEPVMLSTRGHGKMIPLYPIVDQFNHTIVLAVLDGKNTFIDLSDPFRPLGLPKVDALNRMGWLVTKTTSQWIEIVAEKGSETFMAQLSLDDEGTMSGEVKSAYSGYSAIGERHAYKEDPAGTHWIKRLENKYPDAELKSATCENLKNLNERFKENLEIVIPEAGQSNGDFLYVTPVFYTNFDENLFKLKERSYPVDIPYPFQEQYVLTLTLPEGYAVEEVPESVNIGLPNQGGRFQFSATPMNSNQIQLMSKISVKQTLFSPEEYPYIKEFFDLVVEKHTEQIVLKKSS